MEHRTRVLSIGSTLIPAPQRASSSTLAPGGLHVKSSLKPGEGGTRSATLGGGKGKGNKHKQANK